MGANTAIRVLISAGFPRTMRVNTRPIREVWSTFRSFGSSGSSPSAKAIWSLTTLSCKSVRERSSSTLPWLRMPTWSHTSSSSRRLWEETSTVVPRWATSPIRRVHTWRRITGSRPSTGSSRTSTSGLQHRASRKADCFCIPLDSRRMGSFSSTSGKASARASYRFTSKLGYIPR